MGHLWPGQTKKISASVYTHAPPALVRNFPEINWISCANENEICYNVDSTNAQWIRYGLYPRFYYDIVYGNDGNIECSNRVFSDANPGQRKKCELGPVINEITNQLGEWIRYDCVGCPSQTYSITKGIVRTSTTSSTRSTTFETSVTVSASAGFEIKGISASTSISQTSTSSVTNSITNEFQTSKYEEVSFTVVCDKNYLYQFQYTANEFNGNNGIVRIRLSTKFVCSSYSLSPKCAPGFFDINDLTYQTCLSTLPDEGKLSDENNYNNSVHNVSVIDIESVGVSVGVIDGNVTESEDEGLLFVSNKCPKYAHQVYNSTLNGYNNRNDYYKKLNVYTTFECGNLCNNDNKCESFYFNNYGICALFEDNKPQDSSDNFVNQIFCVISNKSDSYSNKVHLSKIIIFITLIFGLF